jgi:NADH:ubiquinone oxidoreductase subunit 2 (subunit N)
LVCQYGRSYRLVVIFLALNYKLCLLYNIGLKQNSLFASEGALKYFLIGSCFSRIILGTSYIYGQTPLQINFDFRWLDESKNSLMSF